MLAFGFVVVAVVGAVVVGFAGDAAAGTSVHDDPDNLIVISGSVDVPRGESIEHVLVFNGDVRVDGRVHGWVVAFNGDVTVNGRVGGT